MKKIVNELLIISFVVYILIFIWIVYFKCNVESWINLTIDLFKEMAIKDKIIYGLIPFQGSSIMEIRSNIYNVIIFIPLPIFIKTIFEKLNYFKLTIICLTVTTIIEFSQLFIPYCAYATEDIICNFIGGVIGILFFKYLLNNNSNYEIKLTLIMFVLFLLPVFVFAIINTISSLEIYKI